MKNVNTPLSRRLILYMVLCSSAITFIISANQLYREYQAELEVIDDALAQIKTVHVGTVMETLWVFDIDKLLIILEGISHIHDIEYVAVFENDKELISVGEVISSNHISDSFPLIHRAKQTENIIGNLKVVIDLGPTYSRILDKAIYIVASNAIKTVIVAGLMLLIIYQVVTRHLTRIAAYLNDIQTGQAREPLVLDRERSSTTRKDDLDFVVESINNYLSEISGYLVENKMAGQLLLETSELSQRIIENAPIGMAIYDSTGQCITTNTAYAEMGGGTQQQVLEQNYNHLESWKNSGLLDAAKRSLNQQKKVREEIEILTTFGRQSIFDVYFMPFETGGEQHLLFMIDDITTRRQNQAEIDKHRNRLELQFEERGTELQLARDELVLIIDTLNGYAYRDVIDETSKETETCVYMTNGVKKLTGYTADEFLGKERKTYPDLIHPEDSEMVWAKVKEAVDTHQEFESHHRIHTRDGEVRWVYERGHGVYDENGEPRFVAGYIIDDHERMKGEIELEKHRNHLEQLVEERTRESKQAREELLLIIGTLNGYVYRDLVDELPDLGFAADNSVYITGGIERLTGYTADELMGKEVEATFSGLMHPDDRDIIYAKTREAIAANQDFELNYRIIKRDGEECWVYERGRGVYDENGEVIYMEGYVIDDSRRKKAETELVEYRDHLEQLVEERTRESTQAQNELTMVIDTLNGFVYRDKFVELSILGSKTEQPVYLTKGVEVLTGYTSAELVDEREMTFPDLIHPEDVDMVWEKVKAAISANRSFELNYRIITRDGEERWVYERGRGVYDENGEPQFIEGYVLDDHERKKAETELVEYRDHLEQLVEERTRELELAQVEMVLVVDTLNGYLYRDAVDQLLVKGQESEKPVYITKGIERLTGYSASELSGKDGITFPDIVHPEDIELMWEKVRKGVDAHQEFEINYRIQTRDGEERWVYERGHGVYDENDEPVFVEGYVIDDHERKIAETELEKYRDHLEQLVEDRTGELEDAQTELVRQGRLATLGQLTATVSHELRNPLAALRASIYTIKKLSHENSNVTFARAVQRSERTIGRCDRIIDELLDYTRITELRLSDILMDEWLNSIIAEQNIPEEINLQKNYSLPELVLSIDAERLRRAIVNVVENACQAMLVNQQPGHYIDDSRLAIETRQEKQGVAISITDSGSGISSDVLEKIYEPLFSTKGFGVGLGMSVVKQIVEQHGGNVIIDSELGKGTTVTVWLPIEMPVEIRTETVMAE